MDEVWNKLSIVLEACFEFPHPQQRFLRERRGSDPRRILLQDWQDLLAQFYLIKSVKSRVLIGQLAGLPVYQAQDKQPPLSAWGLQEGFLLQHSEITKRCWHLLP